MKSLPKSKFLKSQGAMSCLNKRTEACVFPALSFVGASLYLSFLLLIISKIHALAYYNPTNNRKIEFLWKRNSIYLCFLDAELSQPPCSGYI